MIPKSGHASRNGSPLRSAFAGTASFKPDSMSVADDLHPVLHAGRVALVTCAGPFVADRGGYQNLAVVTATPTGAAVRAGA